MHMSATKKRGGFRPGSGRPKAEATKQLEAANMNVALAARARLFGATDKVFQGPEGRKVRIGRDDPLWGSALGRLYAHQIIDYDQHEALLEYGRRRLAYIQIKVEQRPNAASPGFGDTSRGSSCAPEMDEERANRISRKHEDMVSELNELMRTDPVFGLPRILGVYELLDRITVYDREVSYSQGNCGAVRAAANVLARLFKV
jgi:hypothetical protein